MSETAGSGPAASRVLVLDPRDNVATALVDLRVGEHLSIGVGSTSRTMTVRQPIPFGHKVALRPIEAGEIVVKYGSPIGQATVMIQPGEHVHVHNVVSRRGPDASRLAGHEPPGAGC